MTNSVNNFPPHLKFSDTDGINILFVATDPARSLFELTDFEPVEYISKDEHEALIREAEARVWEQAGSIVYQSGDPKYCKDLFFNTAKERRALAGKEKE